MCARRLWTLIGGRGPLPERHVDAAPQRKLGAWSAQDVDTDVGRLVVALEEFTYLTVVFPVVPVSAFLDHLSVAVGLALSDLGVPRGIGDAEAQAIAVGGTFAQRQPQSAGVGDRRHVSRGVAAGRRSTGRRRRGPRGSAHPERPSPRTPDALVSVRRSATAAGIAAHDSLGQMGEWRKLEEIMESSR